MNTTFENIDMNEFESLLKTFQRDQPDNYIIIFTKTFDISPIFDLLKPSKLQRILIIWACLGEVMLYSVNMSSNTLIREAFHLTKQILQFDYTILIEMLDRFLLEARQHLFDQSTTYAKKSFKSILLKSKLDDLKMNKWQFLSIASTAFTKGFDSYNKFLTQEYCCKITKQRYFPFISKKLVDEKLFENAIDECKTTLQSYLSDIQENGVLNQISNTNGIQQMEEMKTATANLMQKFIQTEKKIKMNVTLEPIKNCVGLSKDGFWHIRGGEENCVTANITLDTAQDSSFEYYVLVKLVRTHPKFQHIPVNKVCPNHRTKLVKHVIMPAVKSLHQVKYEACGSTYFRLNNLNNKEHKILMYFPCWSSCRRSTIELVKKCKMERARETNLVFTLIKVDPKSQVQTMMSELQQIKVTVRAQLTSKAMKATERRKVKGCLAQKKYFQEET